MSPFNGGANQNRHLELPTFLDELLLSHSLFFGRSTPSDNVMKSKYGGIDLEIIKDYSENWSSSISAVHISDFPIYGTRLQLIQQRMTDWRPLRAYHAIWYRPYRDSMPVYVFRFAILFGLVSLAGLGCGIYGAVKGSSGGHN